MRNRSATLRDQVHDKLDQTRRPRPSPATTYCAWAPPASWRCRRCPCRRCPSPSSWSGAAPSSVCTPGSRRGQGCSPCTNTHKTKKTNLVPLFQHTIFSLDIRCERKSCEYCMIASGIQDALNLLDTWLMITFGLVSYLVASFKDQMKLNGSNYIYIIGRLGVAFRPVHFHRCNPVTVMTHDNRKQSGCEWCHVKLVV